jgi:hypothetical protein
MDMGCFWRDRRREPCPAPACNGQVQLIGLAWRTGLRSMIDWRESKHPIDAQTDYPNLGDMLQPCVFPSHSFYAQAHQLAHNTQRRILEHSRFPSLTTRLQSRVSCAYCSLLDVNPGRPVVGESRCVKTGNLIMNKDRLS